MIVISDTTPIIFLLKTGNIELLHHLYGRILIPKAVYKELTENPLYSEKIEIIKATEFLSVVAVENKASVNVLRSVTGLDTGESEALIMYDEQKADVLIMDEHEGRSVAKQLNVRFIK